MQKHAVGICLWRVTLLCADNCLRRSRSLGMKSLVHRIGQLPKAPHSELDIVLLQHIALTQPSLSEHIIPVHPHASDSHLPARLVVMEQTLRNVHMLLSFNSKVGLQV